MTKSETMTLEGQALNQARQSVDRLRDPRLAAQVNLMVNPELVIGIDRDGALTRITLRARDEDELKLDVPDDQDFILATVRTGRQISSIPGIVHELCRLTRAAACECGTEARA